MKRYSKKTTNNKREKSFLESALSTPVTAPIYITLTISVFMTLYTRQRSALKPFWTTPKFWRTSPLCDPQTQSPLNLSEFT